MTRDQIQAILKSSGAKEEKGEYVLPEGSSLTLHAAHDGSSLTFQKIESLRFEGDILYGRNPKATVAVVATDIFGIMLEGGTEKARRPAGFSAS